MERNLTESEYGNLEAVAFGYWLGFCNKQHVLNRLHKFNLYGDIDVKSLRIYLDSNFTQFVAEIFDLPYRN